MRLCILISGASANSVERADLLVRAARTLSVETDVIDVSNANGRSLPGLRKGDALYNATRGGLRLEDWLWQPGIVTSGATDWLLEESKTPHGGYRSIRELVSNNRELFHIPRATENC